MREVEITRNGFFLDGNQFNMQSGALHYFRIVPEQWRERLMWLKRFGLNTMNTYMPWNLHEPREREYDFSGMLDIGSYLRLADDIGFKVLLRACPYICAECDFGGLPWWLLKHPDIELRCKNEHYMKAVSLYHERVCREIRPYLYTNGGPVIAMALENEYGLYGNDLDYLRYIKDDLKNNGIDVPLFTDDPASKHSFIDGSLPEVFTTVNVRYNPKAAFSILKEYQPDMPVMVGEFYPGFQTGWGDEYIPRDVDEVASIYDDALSEGAHVCFYMFGGGTNFGFFNGANVKDGCFRPLITSYDVNALLTEYGQPTDKYYACQKVLAKHLGIPELEKEPSGYQSIAFGRVRMTECAPLFENLNVLSQPVHSATPMTMEQLDEGYGFVLYSTVVAAQTERRRLRIFGLADRATVYADGKYIGTVMRDKEEETCIELCAPDWPREQIKLDILVENMGRIKFGRKLKDRKGITDCVSLGNPCLHNWTNRALPLNSLNGLKFGNDMSCDGKPAFYRGYFQAECCADTFLKLPDWTRGCVWINGFNIGRYWDIGPQQRLYVPGPLIREGKNVVEVFEIHNPSKDFTVEFTDKHVLDELK